jgi:hypothetical protein
VRESVPNGTGGSIKSRYPPPSKVGTFFAEISSMGELQQELERLLSELAELDRCSAFDDGGNRVLVTMARRGTKQAIAEVRRLIGQGTTANYTLAAQ